LPPQLKIGKTDVVGNIQIIFNQEMMVPDDWKSTDFSRVFDLHIEQEITGEKI
jgi:hypothetical protein